VPTTHPDIKAGDRIEVYLDHPAVGCGYRAYSVVKVGRRWVTLLYLPTLTSLDLDAAELGRNCTLRLAHGDPRILKRLIKATLRERRSLGLRSATVAAKTVLGQLGGP
jgi:hypothetical protein